MSVSVASSSSSSPSLPSSSLPPSPSPLSSSASLSRPKHLSVFPSRSSMCSTDDVTASPRASIRSSEELQDELSMVTRYAVADLVTTVLRLDFWVDGEPHSIMFCKVVFSIMAEHLGMPEKTTKSLREHLEGETFNEDIATLIMTIRKDEVVSEHGSIVIIASLLAALVHSGCYDSRYRVLLRHLSTLLGVVWDEFEAVEDSLAAFLLSQQFVESEGVVGASKKQSKQIREKTEKRKKIKRYLMIGAAGGVGGVLIGLTGGLAAPLVAAGAGMVVGAGTVAGLATTAGAAVLGSTLGIAGAGLTGYKMKKRVGAIEEFNVETLTEGSSLRTILCVSGWIDKDVSPEFAFKQQWKNLRCAKEQYTLHYESKYLAELGNAIEYLMTFAVSVAIQQTLMETALAGLMTAVAWPVAILSCASVLDNPWNVCISRSTEVGEQLAEVLLSRSHGKRPITLVGFSLGARVIFHCLLTMSKRAESVGIIEDVVLLGAPVSASPKQWAQICSVVGGRVINGYCETDWLLRFVYRTMSVQFTIAGTGPVDNKHNKSIVNHNLSHIVKGHMDYSRKLSEVLSAVQLRTATPEDEDLDLSAADALHVHTANENTSPNSNGVHFDIGEVKVVDER